MRLIAEITEECCPPVLKGVLDEASAEEMASALRVIADPARLRVLSLLSATDEGEACVCDLTGPLGLSQPTVSHHMKVLANAGLVSRQKRGRWAFYRLDRDRLGIVRRALSP